MNKGGALWTHNNMVFLLVWLWIPHPVWSTDFFQCSIFILRCLFFYFNSYDIYCCWTTRIFIIILTFFYYEYVLFWWASLLSTQIQIFEYFTLSDMLPWLNLLFEYWGFKKAINLGGYTFLHEAKLQNDDKCFIHSIFQTEKTKSFSFLNKLIRVTWNFNVAGTRSFCFGYFKKLKSKKRRQRGKTGLCSFSNLSDHKNLHKN